MATSPPITPRRAYLIHGLERRREPVPVDVIGERLGWWRIRALEEIRLAGACEPLRAGETKLVPKYAIVFP